MQWLFVQNILVIKIDYMYLEINVDMIKVYICGFAMIFKVLHKC